MKNIVFNPFKTKNGFAFNGKSGLGQYLNTLNGYSVRDNFVYYNQLRMGRIFKWFDIYELLEAMEVDWSYFISERTLPITDTLFSAGSTLYVIQNTIGQSVSNVEVKLQGCDFRKKQYQKLLSRVNISVEYIILLDEEFKKKQYRDILNYVIDSGCRYCLGYIPLSFLRLPQPVE